MAEIAQLAGFSYIYDCEMIQSNDDFETTHSQMQVTISEW